MPKRRTEKRDEDRDVFGKRRDIVAGARRAFARGGYNGTSVDDVIAEAGVARRTLYQHFSSKEELFAAIIRDQCERLVAPLRGWPADADPKEALTDFGENMIRIVMSDQSLDLYRLVIAESKRFPELGRAFYQSGHGTSSPLLAGYLAEQTRIGTLTVDNPEHAADLFFAMISTTLRMRHLTAVTRKPSAKQCQEWVKQAVVFFLAGCRYAPKKASKDAEGVLRNLAPGRP